MQDKTWCSILGLDAEPLFLQDNMLKKYILSKISLFLGQWLYIVNLPGREDQQQGIVTEECT